MKIVPRVRLTGPLCRWVKMVVARRDWHGAQKSTSCLSAKPPCWNWYISAHPLVVWLHHVLSGIAIPFEEDRPRLLPTEEVVIGHT